MTENLFILRPVPALKAPAYATIHVMGADGRVKHHTPTTTLVSTVKDMGLHTYEVMELIAFQAYKVSRETHVIINNGP